MDHRPLRTVWTQEEDRKLREFVAINGCQGWSIIAERFENRTGKQCRNRWLHVLDPDIRTEEWTVKEQQQLVDLHKRVGKRWAMLSRHIKGRSETAIKNYWNAVNRTKDQPTGPRKADVLRRYLLTLEAAEAAPPSSEGGPVCSSISAHLPEEAHELSQSARLARAESFPTGVEKRTGPVAESHEGSLLPPLYTPPKRRKRAEEESQGGADAPMWDPLPRKKTAFGATGVPVFSVQRAASSADPFSLVGFVRGSTLHSFTQGGADSEARKGAEKAEDAPDKGLDLARVSQEIWAGVESRGSGGGESKPTNVPFRDASEFDPGSAQRPPRDPFNRATATTSRFRVPDALLLPPVRKMERGNASLRSRGAETALLETPLETVEADSKVEMRARDPADSVLWNLFPAAGRVGVPDRDPTSRAHVRSPATYVKDSPTPPSPISLEMSTPGLLGGSNGPGFRPPDAEPLGLLTVKLPEGGTPQTFSATSSNSGDKAEAESHISTTDGLEVAETLGFRPVHVTSPEALQPSHKPLSPQPATCPVQLQGPLQEAPLFGVWRDIGPPTKPRPVDVTGGQARSETQSGFEPQFQNPQSHAELPLQPGRPIPEIAVGSLLALLQEQPVSDVRNASELSAQDLLALFEKYRAGAAAGQAHAVVRAHGALTSGIQSTAQHAELRFPKQTDRPIAMYCHRPQLEPARGLLTEAHTGLTTVNRANPFFGPFQRAPIAYGNHSLTTRSGVGPVPATERTNQVAASGFVPRHRASNAVFGSIFDRPRSPRLTPFVSTGPSGFAQHETLKGNESGRQPAPFMPLHALGGIDQQRVTMLAQNEVLGRGDSADFVNTGGAAPRGSIDHSSFALGSGSLLGEIGAAAAPEPPLLAREGSLPTGGFPDGHDPQRVRDVWDLEASGSGFMSWTSNGF